MRAPAVALLFAAAIVTAGCGAGDADRPEAATTSVPVTEPPGTTVLLVGDSIMEELAPSLEYAVTAGGRDDASFALGGTLPHSPLEVATWRDFLDRAQPDVVVLHLGHWEQLKVIGRLAVGTLREPAQYRTEVIEPALELIRSTGAELVWVGPIPIRDPGETAAVERLAGEWQDALEGREDATYVDVRAAIAPAGYVESEVGPEGPIPLRRDDGIHLCPEGQRRVAEAIVEHLAPHLAQPPDAGWAERWVREAAEPGGCAGYRPGDR